MIKTVILFIVELFFALNLFSQNINYHHFEGKIDGKTKFVLDLNFENQNLTGFYSIQNQKRKTLKGTTTQDSIIQFSEITDSKNKKRDFFQGSIFQGVFKGICKFANSKIAHKFEIAENYNQSQALDIINVNKNLQVDSVFPDIKVSLTYVLPDSTEQKHLVEKLKRKLLFSYFGVKKEKNIDSAIIKMFEIIRKKYNYKNYTGYRDWEFNLKVDVFYNSNNILCLNKNLYVFADQTVLKSDFEYLDFDLQNQEKIDFNEIITPKNKKKLVKFIKEKLEDQGFDKNLVSQKNTINVGLDDYGIHFMFDLFQTDNFIVNLIEIDLPFDEVNTIISNRIEKTFLSDIIAHQ